MDNKKPVLEFLLDNIVIQLYNARGFNGFETTYSDRNIFYEKVGSVLISNYPSLPPVDVLSVCLAFYEIVYPYLKEHTYESRFGLWALDREKIIKVFGNSDVNSYFQDVQKKLDINAT